MASAKTLHDAFIDELRDAYDAEKQLTKALPKMAKAATSEELRTAFEDHLEETLGHVNRLEEASPVSTKKFGGSIVMVLPASLRKASRVWKKISTMPRWMPA